ncbi:uncharacterized protein [Physcomitrium patens]|uniref:Glycosyltransferase 61 catalytic domain-containing protein n=1 Tax=Physcomitrium patens TaxID=3218 RepID=A0A2K1KBL2_PHYPA|nr:uncharacterized protein LOC112284476 [Physcomitrium patens]PNR51162.1 hypothetical protein PHYPA_010348 [Physcomitrium patens]|eukprot:XP_024380065.1 uncharacterized protein LOC112284476 [Physcomitrella patens]
MTPISEAKGKSCSKQPVKFIQLISFLLLFFLVGEFFLQKELASSPRARVACSRFERDALAVLRLGESWDSSLLAAPVLVNSPTVHETFSSDVVVHWDNLTELAPKGLRTHIDTRDSDNVRFMRYGMPPLKNVCITPKGTIVVVGLSPEEFLQDLAAAGKVMVSEWGETYNCSSNCPGSAFEKDTPKDALWLAGNTTHIVPYLGNVFHHFSERVWPLLSGFQDPVDGSYTPVNHYYVHRMHKWLEQAHHNMDRNTFMYQVAILAKTAAPGAKFLQHGENEARPLCFESLTLSADATGRMTPHLGLQNFGPAIDRYRKAAYSYFRIPDPKLSTPPRPMRVTLYGRGDASRRRIVNIDEVAQHLRSMTQPPLLVTIVDELLASGAYNQSLPEVVSLMAQTDVYITPHGANTWATLFMPKRAAVIEIYGPCGPTTWLASTIVPALELKHMTQGNPWGERVAALSAGNTTECKSSYHTPHFTVDLAKLDEEIRSLRVPAGPGDRLPLYWLYNWSTNSY